MNGFDFYRLNGIDLEKHTGTSSYALKQNDAIKMLDILEKNDICIEGVDILCKYDENRYDYLTEPNKYVYWDIENVKKEDRYDFLRNKIQNYDIVKEIDLIAFSFIDDLTFDAWKNHKNLYL